VAIGIFQTISACTDQDIAVSELDATARKIEFATEPSISVFPADQLQLKVDVDDVLFALRKLFPAGDGESKFRPYYVEILSAAQVGLRGPTAAPELGKHTLSGIVRNLVDDVGGTIKNQHLAQLATRSTLFCTVLLVLYFLVCVCVPDSAGAVALFGKLNLMPKVVACFLLLWVGCFVGVVLSYGIRSITLGLADLWRPDADRLSPGKRLLFSGGLTMLAGLIVCSGFVELKIGGVSSAQIFSTPMFALTFGMLAGIGEQKLPEWIGQKAKLALPVS
jgi:hypothetical protein